MVDHSTGAPLKQLTLLTLGLTVGLSGVKGHLEDLVYVGIEVLLSQFSGHL